MDTPHLLVVGDGPVTEKLADMAALLGWRATTAAVLPDATAALPGADAVVVTSHHDDVDAPAIGAALTHGTAYVAAMGSRARQARRREWLESQGVPEETLAALHAPAGLDIGADGPGEIALSILAEALGVLRGRQVPGSIRDRGGPVHPDAEPGTAYCPPG